MYCRKCGQKLKEGTKFCSDCGEAVESTKKETQKDQKTDSASEQIYGPTTSSSFDMKQLSQILSYFGILFIVGLVSSEKDDPNVRFHVGQGIILFIFEVILNILNFILIQFIFTPLFRREVKIWGFVTGYEMNPFGQFLIAITSIVVYGLIIYMVVRGVMNVIKKEKKELPLIGKFAFYK